MILRRRAFLRDSAVWTSAAWTTAGGLAPFALGCGAAPDAPAFGAGFVPVAATPETSPLEHAMFLRLNQDRAQGGLPALVYDERLAGIGRTHSDDMHQHHFFAHESPTRGNLEDRLDRAGYLAVVGRENLAEAPDVVTAQNGLMKSPGHHANIMADDITHIGIGIVRGGILDPQNFLFTQVFARPGQASEPDAVAKEVTAKLVELRKARGAPAVPTGGAIASIAQKHVAELADDVNDASTDRVSQSVQSDLARLPSPGGNVGLAVAGALILDLSMYETPDVALGSGVREIGVAAARAKDARGRPAVKVLLLVLTGG